MRKRGVTIPRVDSLEDRVVLSHIGSQLISSAAAEYRKLHTSINNKSVSADLHNLNRGLKNTFHNVQHTVSHQVKTVVNHVPTQKTTDNFWDSLKKMFGFK